MPGLLCCRASSEVWQSHQSIPRIRHIPWSPFKSRKIVIRRGRLVVKTPFFCCVLISKWGYKVAESLTPKTLPPCYGNVGPLGVHRWIAIILLIHKSSYQLCMCFSIYIHGYFWLYSKLSSKQLNVRSYIVNVVSFFGWTLSQQFIFTNLQNARFSFSIMKRSFSIMNGSFWAYKVVISEARDCIM